MTLDDQLLVSDAERVRDRLDELLDDGLLISVNADYEEIMKELLDSIKAALLEQRQFVEKLRERLAIPKPDRLIGDKE